MAIHDNIMKEVIKKYKDDCSLINKTPGYVYIQYGGDNISSEFTMNSLREYVFHAKKHKMKNFHPISVDPVQSDQINSYCTGIKLDNNRKNPFTFSDMTGIFKMTFSDGTFMYLAKWLNGAGRNQKFENLFAAEKEIWIKFLKYVNRSKKYRLKPKNGVFKIDIIKLPGGASQLVYNELKTLNETPIIHPEIENVNKDMNFFFDNMPQFTRYKMPGVRKIMLVGEPGSGKTSYCVKLSKKMGAVKSFVFATSISAVAEHLKKCAKYNVSTIVILEDAESSISMAGSSILNFLDGIDQPTNKNGAYIIMTTNHPNMIEPRILQRPGRIDKIFKFDALKGATAVRCAEIYLKGYMTEKDEKEIMKDKAKIAEIVDGMTGAQIKALIDGAIAYAVSNNTSMSLQVLEETKESMFKSLKEVYDYAKSNSINKKKSLGFKKTESVSFDQLEIINEEDDF